LMKVFCARFRYVTTWSQYWPVLIRRRFSNPRKRSKSTSTEAWVQGGRLPLPGNRRRSKWPVGHLNGTSLGGRNRWYKMSPSSFTDGFSGYDRAACTLWGLEGLMGSFLLLNVF
jgi:hypothetical protein